MNALDHAHQDDLWWRRLKARFTGRDVARLIVTNPKTDEVLQGSPSMTDHDLIEMFERFDDEQLCPDGRKGE